MNQCDGFDLLNGMIKSQILRILPEEGRLETAVSGLALTRYDSGRPPERCLYSPMVAFVVQGLKKAFYGEIEASYGQGQCVVLGIDVPGVYQILNASRDDPFLSISVKLDNQIIYNLFGQMPWLSGNIPQTSSPIGVINVDLPLLDAFRRLVDLLEYPERIPILAPMVLREIHFYILSGRLGSQLKLFSTSGTKANMIRCAISWLRENYKFSLRIADIAAKVNMAPSTFNRYFRQVTGLSPLQFQKHLRLHEAERLMLVENSDASSAALAVGYESGSQFTREYKRLFGSPPRRDIASRQP